MVMTAQIHQGILLLLSLTSTPPTTADPEGKLLVRDSACGGISRCAVMICTGSCTGAGAVTCRVDDFVELRLQQLCRMDNVGVFVVVVAAVLIHHVHVELDGLGLLQL